MMELSRADMTEARRGVALRNTACGLVVLCLALLTTPADADEIVLAADEWCPYNCAADARNPGFMIEIAKYAFERKGHTVKYINVPWARAIIATRNGSYDGIVGAGREETPDFIFPNLPLGTASHTFYVRDGETWRYDGLESLKKIRLGVIKDYSYGTLAADYIEPNANSDNIQVVSGETALAQLISLHGSKRIDAFIEGRTVLEYFLHEAGQVNNFVDAGVASVEEVFIAFSPKQQMSSQYAAILDQGLIELRASGGLRDILDTYGVTDWATD